MAAQTLSSEDLSLEDLSFRHGVKAPHISSEHLMALAGVAIQAAEAIAMPGSRRVPTA
jgi:hypothetical protein